MAKGLLNVSDLDELSEITDLSELSEISEVLELDELCEAEEEMTRPRVVPHVDDEQTEQIEERPKAPHLRLLPPPEPRPIPSSVPPPPLRTRAPLPPPPFALPSRPASLPPPTLPPVPRAPSLPPLSMPPFSLRRPQPPASRPTPIPIPIPMPMPPTREPMPIPSPVRESELPAVVVQQDPEPPRPPQVLPSSETTRPNRIVRRLAERRLIRDTAIAAGSLVLTAVVIALAVVGVRSMFSPAARDMRSNVVVTAAGPAGRVVPNVSVFANGALLCQTTPCTLSTLDSGVHFVQVVAAGFAPTATRAVVVDGLKPLSVHFDLEPEAGVAVAIPAVPPAPQAVAPVAEQSEASPPNAERRAAPRARAKPAAAGFGTLDLASTPSASVVVDGKPLGSTPQSVRVAPGAHSVLFVHPELGRAARQISVAAGARQGVSVQLGR